MPITLKDDQGNSVELPVDKVEDVKGLAEKANRVTTLEKDLEEAKKGVHPEWPATRAKIDKLEKDLEEARKSAGQPPVGGGQPGAVDEAKAKEISKQAAGEALAEQNAKQVTAKRDKLLNELSGGDENTKKVILEKYTQLTGNRVISDEDEMRSALKDAHFLANKNKNGAGNQFDKVVGNGGSGSSGPNRDSSKSSIEHGASLATRMGYQPKSNVHKK